ncbi:hypothetical protein LAZ67_6001981 [Cordylochernes scorpioides]|uniref:ZP domain-containing protein n=1 Tax=Cordylochernes scorpioides TaxID=51811 RepID=A0ABY6KMH0_9ARAC|nr:hypothetical protein LAZ67_6001981 [Cordylochernes scorpioides]
MSKEEIVQTTCFNAAGAPLVSGVKIHCNSNNIVVSMAAGAPFNGMIYPKGLSKNASCMAEYSGEEDIQYSLPLRSCNTMSMDLIIRKQIEGSTVQEDGVEYFNTVVIQPHRKLVTNQGRGYHIRCRYQTRDKTIFSGFNVSMLGTTPLTATAAAPDVTMQIFLGDPEDNQLAENVKIGDQLSLMISLEQQDIYGIKVTNCLVRDGLNWGEQPLIDEAGCPVDVDIMGEFVYSGNLTAATVKYPAHKFPYTSSVLYQCNVRLCLLQMPGDCDGTVSDLPLIYTLYVVIDIQTTKQCF